MTRDWTEAEIAAFIAGRLQGPDADRIATALETDPAAQAAAERIGAADPGDATLRAAFAAPLAEMPPAAMRAALLAEPGKVATLPRRAPMAWLPAALAASLALGAGFGAGWSLKAPGGPEASAAVAVGPAQGALRLALDASPAGTAQGGVVPTASFRDGAGRICREFDALDASGAPAAAGVACRAAEGWRVLLLAATPDAASAQPGFAPAAGVAADPIGDFLGALDAGPALSPAEEAALIARGWR